MMTTEERKTKNKIRRVLKITIKLGAEDTSIIPDTWEAETRGLQVQVSLSYLTRLCLKIKNKNGRDISQW